MSYTRKLQRSRAKRGIFLRPLPLILLVLGAGILAITTLELTNTTHLFHKRKAVSSTIPSEVSTEPETDTTDSSDSAPQTTPNNPNKTPPPSSDKTITTPISGLELIAPSGSFVSNHRPTLKNSPGVESVCTTTPGAMCTVTFTKDGVTKTLESKKTDNNGTVIWTWDIKSAGFVAGTWQITATATLDDKTKSTNDLQPMEVQP